MKTTKTSQPMKAPTTTTKRTNPWVKATSLKMRPLRKHPNLRKLKYSLIEEAPHHPRNKSTWVTSNLTIAKSSSLNSNSRSSWLSTRLVMSRSPPSRLMNLLSLWATSQMKMTLLKSSHPLSKISKYPNPLRIWLESFQLLKWWLKVQLESIKCPSL